MRTLLFIVLMLVAAGSPAAITYRWVDADGVHYSDQPHPGAEKVVLGEPQVYSSQTDTQGGGAAPPAAAAGRRPARNAPFHYDSCAVVQPADDEVLLQADSVTIAVQVRPAKRSGDLIMLSLDGKVIEPGSPDQNEFRITPIDRGTHTVAAVVRGSDGKPYCNSPLVSFHVRQDSLLAPARPGKAH